MAQAEIIQFPFATHVAPDNVSDSVRAERPEFSLIGEGDLDGKLKFEFHTYNLTGAEAREFTLLYGKLRGLN